MDWQSTRGTVRLILGSFVTIALISQLTVAWIYPQVAIRPQIIAIELGMIASFLMIDMGLGMLNNTDSDSE